MPDLFMLANRGDGEEMPPDLGIRDVSFNYRTVTPGTLNRERQKRLDRGPYIEDGWLTIPN
jgi:hypothetical protein